MVVFDLAGATIHIGGVMNNSSFTITYRCSCGGAVEVDRRGESTSRYRCKACGAELDEYGNVRLRSMELAKERSRKLVKETFRKGLKRRR